MARESAISAIYDTEMEVTYAPEEGIARALRQYCTDNGVKIDPDHPLGRGVSAKVYALSDTEVLLMTYVKSKVAVARVLNLAHEVVSYNVRYKINRYDDEYCQIYAIRMKRLLPLHCGTKDHEYQYAMAESIVSAAIRRAGNWRDAWDIVRHASDADDQLRLLAHLAYISPSTPGADMHGGNAMIDPDSGDLIYTDILHYYAEEATTPMVEEIPTIEDLPDTSEESLVMITCDCCGELVDPEVADEMHNQLVTSGIWCNECIADNLCQVNTGSCNGLWARIEDILATDNKIFWCDDSRVTWDDVGDLALRERLVTVNGILLGPDNVCKDIFGAYHDKRDREISWDCCADCGAIIPINTDGRMHQAHHHNLRMFRQFLGREIIATDIRKLDIQA